METYQGYVKTPGDAVVLFEACRLGLLPRVQRRLSEKERQLIKSGSVFVWDEREAGMRRWTDGKSWSASRVNGSFLTYREMEGKRNGGSYPSAGSSSSRRNASPAGSTGEGQEGDGTGEGPDGYRYKPDGLIKQSFSITTSVGQHLHLISYFARSHLSSSSLLQPSQDPQLRGLRPPKGMYPESSVADNQSTPAMTRSPMVGPPYTESPQLQASAASSPQYAQPGRSHGTQAPPGYDWPPSPMATPPTGNSFSPYRHQYQSSPYQNGHPSTGTNHSPLYQSHHAYAQNTRPPPGPTDFDRAPPPMTGNGVPPPPPSYVRNTGYPPIAPAPAPQTNPPQTYDIPPPPPRPQSHGHEYPPPPPPPASYHHQQQQQQTYRQPEAPHDQRPEDPNNPIDPRLAPTQSLNPLHPPTHQDPSRTGTAQTGQPPPTTSHMIPSIGALINGSEPADRSPAGGRSRVGSAGASGVAGAYNPANGGEKTFNEDARALRQLDKAFSQSAR